MEKMNLPSDSPVSPNFGNFVALSKSKLGSAHSTSTALSRKVAIKNLVKYFEQLKSWQQKLIVAALIERCSGPDLEQLNNTLEPLTHRGYLASFNKRYPAVGFASKIDHKKAEFTIHRLFDNIFSLKVDWKQAVRSKRYGKLRQMYLQEQWRPCTPIYYSANIDDFSRHIHEAVARILKEQKLPVTASPEAADEGGVHPKPASANVVLSPSSQHSSKVTAVFLRPSSKTQGSRTGFRQNTLVKETDEEELYRPPVQLSRPQSQLSLIEDNSEELRLQTVDEHLTGNEDSKSQRVAASIRSEDAASRHVDSLQQTSFTFPDVLARPSVANDYSNKHPSVLRSFRPEATVSGQVQERMTPKQHPVVQKSLPTIALGSFTSEPAVCKSAPDIGICGGLTSTIETGHSSQPSLTSANKNGEVKTLEVDAVVELRAVGAATDLTTPMEEIDTSQPMKELDTSQPMKELDTSQLMEELDSSQPMNEIDSSQPMKETVMSPLVDDTDTLATEEVISSTPLTADPVIAPVTAREPDIQAPDGVDTAASMLGVQDGHSIHSGSSGDDSSVEPNSDRKPALALVGLLNPDKSEGTATTEAVSSGSMKSLSSVSFTDDKKNLISKMKSSSHHFDICEDDLPHFQYELEEEPAMCEEEVIAVVDNEAYQPTDEELVEDNNMVSEFSTNIFNTLHKSKDHVNDERDLAEVIAECVLSSSVGLALFAANSKFEMRRSRFLVLRDRMSSEAMQATIRVFRIKPPLQEKPSTPPKVDEMCEAPSQQVRPFTPEPEPVIRKISQPHMFFKKPKKTRQLRTTSYKRGSQHARQSSHLTNPSSLTKGRAKPRKQQRNAELSEGATVFDKEAQLPDMEAMRTQDLCGRKAKKSSCQSVDNKKREFQNEMEVFNEKLRGWQTSDIVSLLTALISSAYKHDESVLPLVAKSIRYKVQHITNITELPDRLLIGLFKYLDVNSLESCQQVCRRWAFLCSRPELWIVKCNQLGYSYGIAGLCKRIFDAVDNSYMIDWQMAYRELSASLRQLYRPPDVHLHPAVLASRAYASRVNIANWHQDVALPPISRDEKDDSSSLSTPKSTLIVSDFTNSDHFHPKQNSPKPSDEKVRPQPPRQFVRKSRFPRLKLKGNVLVLAAEDNSHSSELAGDAVKECQSTDTVASWSLINAEPSVRAQPDAAAVEAKKDSLTTDKKKANVNPLSDLALDIRTDLTAAKALSRPHFIRMKPSHSQKALSLANRKGRQLGEHLPTPASISSIAGTFPSLLAEKENEEMINPILWLNSADYNPKDFNISRRLIGYVKPVTRVQKFWGHSDVIFSCDFDRKRVFTAGRDGVISLWDIRSSRKVQQLHGHTGSVRSIVLDSSKDLLYTASWDTTIIIWDVVKFVRKASLVAHTAAVVDIKLCQKLAILCSASNDGSVRVWSSRTFRCMQTLHVHSANVSCLYFDGDVIASGDVEGKVVIHHRSSGGDYHHFTTCGEVEKTLKDVSSVANIVISGGQAWDKATRDRYMVNGIMSVLVINDLVLGGTNHGELCCWCINTGVLVMRFDIHVGGVTSINRWCQRILTSGSDGVMKEWDLGTMTCVRRLHDHPDAIHCTRVDETLEKIVSVGEDRIVHVWHFNQEKVGRVGGEITPRARSLPSYAVERAATQGH